jgi:hypothetical protein
MTRKSITQITKIENIKDLTFCICKRGDSMFDGAIKREKTSTLVELPTAPCKYQTKMLRICVDKHNVKGWPNPTLHREAATNATRV